MRIPLDVINELRARVRQSSHVFVVAQASPDVWVVCTPSTVPVSAEPVAYACGGFAGLALKAVWL